MSTTPTVVCHGRAVDDYGQAKGDRCTNRFSPPGNSDGPARLAEVDRLVSFRPPPGQRFPTFAGGDPLTADEVAEMAVAAGWAVAPTDEHDAHGELMGTCPSCRRPPREVAALVREVRRRAA